MYEVQILQNQKISTNIKNYLDETNFPILKQMKFMNEEENQNSFDGFNDLQMIYFFVHQKKDIKKVQTEDTKREYLRELLQFISILHENQEALNIDEHEVAIKYLKRRHIEAYQEYIATAPLGRNQQPYKVTTLSRKTVILKAFFKFLYKVGYTNENLCDGLLSSNVHRDDLPNRDMTYAEVQKLLEFYKDAPIQYGLILVLATTGIRIRELADARFKDLTCENGEYWLKVVGKRRKERDVYIFPYVFDAIVEYRKRRRLPIELNPLDESPLFTSFNNKKYGHAYLSKYMTKVLSRTGFDFLYLNGRNGIISPHHLRHFFAIYSAEQGADVFRIQQSLGHESIKTTMLYLDKKSKRKNNVAMQWKNKEAF
ncbi:tyrosine-type recombinase/integrase [Gottfriedia luciferensis]|uniref:tyrosine-type recombinase/integrase n=1 Tax=Gottfriedia luciferensis TaxID=178774 RepID=UPI000B431D1F|nr:tyrosine-type recombinase/integrase [Gottfriedia luciferensis]